VVRCNHQFGLSLADDEGRPLAEVTIVPDWEPAHEWTRFDAIRAGRLSPAAPHGSAELEPLWHEAMGPPYVRGFRVRVRADGQEASADFNLEHFRALALATSSRLVEAGALAEGTQFRFLVTAFEREALPEPEGPGLVTRQIVPPLALHETPLARFAAGAEPVVPETPGDMPVFVPADVLEEARQLARSAGDKETGGVLVGHLHRDATGALIFAEVTAQIPAAHTVADAATLTFTRESWSDVRGVLKLRNRGELMLGWWHSHVIYKLCTSSECNGEKRRDCRLATSLFSADDRLLHRTMFVRSYGLALVVNVLRPGEETFSMFGWRDGLLQSRGFAVRAAEAPDAA
jgi:hypothetical protein